MWVRTGGVGCGKTADAKLLNEHSLCPRGYFIVGTVTDCGGKLDEIDKYCTCIVTQMSAKFVLSS